MDDTSPLLVRRLSRGQLVAFDCLMAWGISLAFLTSSAPAQTPPWVRPAVALGLGLPLAVRRLRPRTVFCGVLAVALVATVFHVVRMPYLAPACALYTVALTGREIAGLPTAWVAALTAFVLTGLLVAPVWWEDGLREALSGVAAMGGAWTVGRAVAERRAYAKRTAEQLARESVAEERLRIARELHDVVAHSMGLIAVKAGVANHVIGSSPEEAGDALRVIESESRSALAEMRRMLGLLRTDPAELAPFPGVHGLPSLGERANLAGVKVEMDVRGVEELPQGVGLTVYRIAQEAITNVIKHASPAHCRVDIEADGRRVRVEVTDDGPGRRTLPPNAGGHGLIGMRERVLMYGGVFEAGPRSGAGFRVFACLPYEGVS
ncbi:sensor histidine kinase [Sphaerisporangium fuscum]|uniref:sensor histidine kinase n=1 Tax=Sphaerisporangium fuscum TaxID=2835868 RepID=UPI001BDBF905|nr:sensor histidine kinase [Sphaerisporangium fuscum]